jgi:hypothetical protein
VFPIEAETVIALEPGRCYSDGGCEEGEETGLGEHEISDHPSSHFREPSSSTLSGRTREFWREQFVS